MTDRVRVDQLLVELGLAPSRAKAQALVLAGEVSSGEVRLEKPGTLVPRSSAIALRGNALPYVSRGGLKLEGALSDFAISVKGLRCLDVGASTGGFTDCLLQHGAERVVAVDVGYGQLAQKLRDDPRVVVQERTNARELVPEAIDGAVDLTVVDASFIGLSKLLLAIARCTLVSGHLLALVKPQFEVGKREAARGRGVVRDPEIRGAAIERVVEDVVRAGFSVLGVRDCRVPGPKGNVEAFVYAEREGAPPSAKTR